MTSEDVLTIRCKLNFDRFDVEELELMENAFSEQFFINKGVIERDHPAKYRYQEYNDKLSLWIDVIRELRLERNGSDTD